MLSTKMRRTTLLDSPKRRAMPEHTPAMTRSLDGRARLAMVADPSSWSRGAPGRVRIPPCPSPGRKARVRPRDEGRIRVGPGAPTVERMPSPRRPADLIRVEGWQDDPRDVAHLGPLRRLPRSAAAAPWEGPRAVRVRRPA